jgi:hypothetical protein
MERRSFLKKRTKRLLLLGSDTISFWTDTLPLQRGICSVRQSFRCSGDGAPRSRYDTDSRNGCQRDTGAERR